MGDLVQFDAFAEQEQPPAEDASLRFQLGKVQQELNELREVVHAVLNYMAERNLVLVKVAPVPEHFKVVKMQPAQARPPAGAMPNGPSAV